jgi:hypothetical protein
MKPGRDTTQDESYQLIAEAINEIRLLGIVWVAAKRDGVNLSGGLLATKKSSEWMLRMLMEYIPERCCNTCLKRLADMEEVLITQGSVDTSKPN